MEIINCAPHPRHNKCEFKWTSSSLTPSYFGSMVTARDIVVKQSALRQGLSVAPCGTMW